MKIFSLGNFDKKIFLLLIVYVIIVILIGSINHFYLINFQINLSIQVLITFGFGVFFIIPEIIIGKSNKKKEEVSNINRNNNILYLFTKPKKKILKGITILIIIFILHLVFVYSSRIILDKGHEKLDLMDTEGYRSVYIIYFLLFSQIIDKTEFYRHHYIPLLITILMGLIRFIINLRHKNYEFIFPEDLLILLSGIGYSLGEPALFFAIQQSMKYRFYSPIFIHLLLGTINSFLAIIIYFIFMNADCGENDYCLILSKETKIEKITIVVLVIYSFIYSLYYFVVIVLIYNFSVFHWLLLLAFELLIQTLFSFSDYTILNQIILIVTYIIEIFAILVFIEIIILNFCGFNYNIRKNIYFRAEDEIHQLEEEYNDTDDNNDDSINSGNLIEFPNNNNNNRSDEETSSNY